MKREIKNLIFLTSIIFLYSIIFFIRPENISDAITMALNISYRILPVLGFVFVIMALANYFFNNKKLKQKLQQQKSSKNWFFTIGAGILSSGPIYAWYPLLEQAKQKGLHIKYICAFIYARAIKIPFIPILITYFGVIYTTTLLVFLIIFAIVQGIVLEKIMQPKRQI